MHLRRPAAEAHLGRRTLQTSVAGLTVGTALGYIAGRLKGRWR